LDFSITFVVANQPFINRITDRNVQHVFQFLYCPAVPCGLYYVFTSSVLMTVPFRANISAGDLGFGIPISHAMQEASTRFRGI